MTNHNPHAVRSEIRDESGANAWRQASVRSWGGPTEPDELAALVRDPRRRLARLAVAARLVLVISDIATILAVGVAAVLAAAIADYILRTPDWLRMILWATGAGAGGWVMFRRLRASARFRPDPIVVALRLEQSEAGQGADLRGVLASALELAADPPSAPAARWMAWQVVQTAARRFAGVRAGTILRVAPAWRAVMWLGLSAGAVAIAGGLAGRELSAIAVARILTPWWSPAWPKRTLIVDATARQVQEATAAIALQAALLRSDRPPDQTPVWVHYRRADVDTSPRRALMTPQARRVAIGTDEPRHEGELFERLIDPGELGVMPGVDASLVAELEYWFETRDDRTSPGRVRLVPPPAIVGARVRITPPPYAVGAPVLTGEHDLSPAAERPASIGPVLAHSHIELRLTLNKDVPAPVEPSADLDRPWSVSQAFPGGLPAGAQVRCEGRVWTLDFPAREPVRVRVSLRDAHGIGAREEPEYAFDVVPDRAPTASVIHPPRDEDVLASALVAVVGEARDDLGLTMLALEYQQASSPAGSVGAAPEPRAPPRTFAQRDLEPGTVVAADTLGGELDLATLTLSPGDEIWVTVAARDGYAQEGQPRPAVRSAARRLRVISEEQFVAQIRQGLAQVRSVAMRLHEQQEELRRAVARGVGGASERRGQQTLSLGAARQAQAVADLSARAVQNRLEDAALAGLLDDAHTLLEDAAEASERAAQILDAAVQEASDPGPVDLSEAHARQIAQAQQEVLEHLRRVAELLDRGEDAWVLARTLRELARQQRDLAQATRRTGQPLAGQPPENLPERAREELERLARQQTELGQDAARTIEALEQRAEQLSRADPGAAEGLRQAARRGRDRQVPALMERAAAGTRHNRTGEASQQQEQAAEVLEQMVRDVTEPQRTRDARLRRLLTDLLSAIERLVREQETQLDRLRQRGENESLTGLDVDMMALHTATLSTAERATRERSARAVAQRLDRAAEAQSLAVAALRTPSPADAEHAENESLEHLRAARDEARRLRDEAAWRDDRRRREELRQAYREALEQQAAIRGETEPLVGAGDTRLARVRARALGERQDNLRQDLARIRTRVEEIAEAGVFAFAHERLDDAASGAAGPLRLGRADGHVLRHQDTVMRVLASLVEALEEQLRREDPFREGEAGGGGGEGGGARPPLLPPIAELRLLRGLQADAAALTRALHEAGPEPDPAEMTSLGRLQRDLARRGEELARRLRPADPPRVPGTPSPPPRRPAPPVPEGGERPPPDLAPVERLREPSP